MAAHGLIRASINRHHVEFQFVQLIYKRIFPIGGATVNPSSKVRFAAFLALRNSLGIFITALLLVPVDSIINRIFDGSWNVNWRLMLVVSGILTGVFFAFFFIAQVLEFWTHGDRELNGQVVFPAVMWLRGIYLAGILMGLWLMIWSYREHAAWWDVALPSVFVLIGFFAWPRAIQITENEIRQRSIILGVKRIPFGEIQRVVYDPTRKEIVVFGKSGDRIVHTMMHVDGERFMERLESLTGKSAYSVGDLGQNIPAK